MTTTFYFCLGADAFLDLTAGKWNESARVLKLLDGGRRLVVLHRRGGAEQQEQLDNSGDGGGDSPSSSPTDNNDRLLTRRVQETGARLLRIGHLGSISSSQVRECASVNELNGMVVPQVLDYMRDNHLYQFATTTTSTSEEINDDN